MKKKIIDNFFDLIDKIIDNVNLSHSKKTKNLFRKHSMPPCSNYPTGRTLPR